MNFSSFLSWIAQTGSTSATSSAWIFLTPYESYFGVLLLSSPHTNSFSSARTISSELAFLASFAIFLEANDAETLVEVPCMLALSRATQRYRPSPSRQTLLIDSAKCLTSMNHHTTFSFPWSLHQLTFSAPIDSELFPIRCKVTRDL